MEEAEDVIASVEWPALSAERGKTVGERRDNPTLKWNYIGVSRYALTLNRLNYTTFIQYI